MSAAIESLVQLSDPGAVAAEIGRINALVGRGAEVPEEAWQLVGDMNSKLDQLDVPRWGRVDSHLQAVFLSGYAQVNKALKERETPGARALLRIGLERIRHALEEMSESSRTGDEGNPKELVRWLSEAIPVPQQELARLIMVDRRKLQRWLHPDGPRPEGSDALRVTVVARIVNQLRHSFTPVGVLRWFDRPRAELGGETPSALLADTDRIPQLIRLAASVRHSDAA